jgi:hypothetical protein
MGAQIKDVYKYAGIASLIRKMKYPSLPHPPFVTLHWTNE